MRDTEELEKAIFARIFNKIHIGETVAGAVKAHVDYQGRLHKLEVDESLLKKDNDMALILEAIKGAVNSGLDKSTKFNGEVIQDVLDTEMDMVNREAN